MDRKLSPWSTEPDAPGVLISGTPPSTLSGGAAAGTAQALRLAVEAAQHDFSHTVRAAIERARIEALAEAEGRRTEVYGEGGWRLLSVVV